jgi:hypothetical protein
MLFYFWISKCKYPVGFSFVSKGEEPSFSIRRIGFYAGSVYMDTKDKSVESHYFVKVDKMADVKYIYDTIDSLHFKHKNTVGPRSISKQELLRKLPKKLVTKK